MLLLAGAVLVTLFWHLPVPPFLFADAGSGSGSVACTCTLGNSNCDSWAKETAACNCAGATPAWEACSHDTYKQVCAAHPSTTKSWPMSIFYYEFKANWCNNIKTCTHPAPPAGTTHVVDNCVGSYTRKVDVDRQGGIQGVKTIEFKPTLTFEFEGFSHANVCVDTPTDKRIKFESGLFATMTVCGDEIKDLSKTDDTGLIGWDFFPDHEFSHDGNQWRITPETADSRTASFNLSKVCACAATDDDPVERVRFVCHVKENTGVELGNDPTSRQADVKFYLTTDTTTCAPAPPP
jgi:hypothetical protein